MKALAGRIPAWALTLMPVRFARQYAIEHAPMVASSSNSTRQLLVDVSVIHQSDARTGIQRVVRELLLQLLRTPPAGYSVCPVFATRQHGYRYAAPNFLDPPVQVSDALVSPETTDVQVECGDLFLGLDLAAHLLPRHQAQVLQWKRNGVKVHVLVYDLLPLQHPEWFKPKTTRNFNRWIKWVASYADSAICISETVKIQLHTWLDTNFGIPPSFLPASTIVLGADIDDSASSRGLPADAQSLLVRLRNTSSLLMVSTLEPRKGYDQALAAFEQLWQMGNESLLVIVGRPGWNTEVLQKRLRCHPQAGQRLFWLEDVSDEYLNHLYAECGGVLVASRAEGFGLPLIEATLHNKPVLARDLPVFREIGLPGVTFFCGESASSLATAISDWQQKMVLVDGAIQHRSQNLFTWRKAAIQLLSSLGLQAVPKYHANLFNSHALAQEAAP